MISLPTTRPQGHKGAAVRSESALEPLAHPGGVREEGYYGLPFLKRPLWGWEIAFYFFFEGVSSGTFLCSALAGLSGGKRYRPFVRASRYIACATMLPCPYFLIRDLGRPERFLHMLRIVKWTSPMSIGAWALNAYGQQVTVLAMLELAPHLPASIRGLLRWVPERLVEMSTLPFALLMMAYPGVLLETTSVPAWSSTQYLGPLIGASSLASATAVLSLLPQRHPAVGSIGAVAHGVEAAALAAYLCEAGPSARVVRRGRYAPLFWVGAVGAGILAPLALDLLPAPRRKQTRRRRGILSAVLSLAGGLALKWVLVHAGRLSALDPAANRHASEPSSRNPGWHGSLTPAVPEMPATP